uniref:Ubiquitin thioesterase OTU n=1 Tax=Aureoumbra lagunensis TaxID=44058 RepID=A0A7S3K7S6_9STRA|mmetsp:Transcript_16817/g.25303  ORF Transcript_16817/g.25303 Transcript_16817/m.25303 type:complete len:532 (-) Transcript_16817:354-1949(-)
MFGILAHNDSLSRNRKKINTPPIRSSLVTSSRLQTTRAVTLGNHPPATKVTTTQKKNRVVSPYDEVDIIKKNRIVSAEYDESSSDEDEENERRSSKRSMNNDENLLKIPNKKKLKTATSSISTIVDASDDEKVSSMKVTPTGSEGSPSDTEIELSRIHTTTKSQEPQNPKIIDYTLRQQSASKTKQLVQPKEQQKEEKNKPQEQVTEEISCDRCDGRHPTHACPYFSKGRDNHPDALNRKPSSRLGSDGGNAYLEEGTIINQPGDGSCLFHSLLYGYKRLKQSILIETATNLRHSLMDWLQENQDTEIADSPVKDWIRWDSNSQVSDYVRRMRIYGWGGGIEMAAFARKFQIEVHVYEKMPYNARFPFKRISRFSGPSSHSGSSVQSSPVVRSPVVNVVYRGGVHYDALITSKNPVYLRPDPTLSSHSVSPQTTATPTTPTLAPAAGKTSNLNVRKFIKGNSSSPMSPPCFGGPRRAAAYERTPASQCKSSFTNSHSRASNATLGVIPSCYHFSNNRNGRAYRSTYNHRRY